MTQHDPSFTDCRACLCSALRRADRAVTQHYEERFRGTGMRATQFTLLATLAQTGPITISALADLLATDRTTLTRNLRPLESKGWLRDLPVDADQRLRQVVLTPKGRSAATQALPAWRRAQASVGPILDRFGIRLSSTPRIKK